MKGAVEENSNIHAFIDGEPSALDVDQLELRSARRALRLLKERITPEQMDELLADDLKSTDEQWRKWATASDGSWKVAEVEFRIAGVSKQQFSDWWSAALTDLHTVVYPAFPEHYRFGWVKDPRGVNEPCYIVVEELGHVPFRMYCSFDPSYAPVEPAAGYDAMMVGVGRLADGTEVVKFMNQLMDTDEGFVMKVAVYVVSAVPDSVVRSHVEQQLVEWTRWLEMVTKVVQN
ncbi:hypothetical protein [Paraburkholderia dipogonis]|jgi:hypothetical protein|uniref:hypothetical protein n=1 Tax=Paraburkholderia dipogonis TaxID=1211383 RepID=UPI0038BBFE2E